MLSKPQTRSASVNIPTMTRDAMTLRIPPPPSSDKGENNADRFLSVQFTILKTKLPLAEKVVYALIASWQDRTCFYSHDYFAEALSCSKRKAQDVVTSLAKKGLIEVIPRVGDTNVYKALPWQDLLSVTADTLAESATPPSRICHSPTQDLLPPLAESATYKNNYKINDKIIDENTVADAPSPTFEFPLSLEEPQDSDPLQESDSLEKPIEVSEAPPIPAAPPKKAKSSAGRKVTFPSPDYWASVKPDLLSWMRDHGAEGSDEVLLPWIDERLEKLEGAALSKDMKYAAWDRTFMTWYRHLIPDKYKRGFDWFVRNAVDQTKFVEVWKKKKELEAFGYSDEGIEGYRKTLLNFDEDSPWGGNKIKHFRKTVQKGA